MKRLRCAAALFFYLLTVVTFLNGCAVNEKSADAGELIVALSDEIKEISGRGLIYFDLTRKSENGNIHIISEEKLGYLYTGLFEPLPCQNRIKSYAVRLPSDMGGCEIHVIECVNPSDCDEIAVFLEKRINKLKSSEVLSIAPETHETCFKGAEVYKKSRFVFLLATPDNQAVKKVIGRYL